MESDPSCKGLMKGGNASVGLKKNKQGVKNANEIRSFDEKTRNSTPKNTKKSIKTQKCIFAKKPTFLSKTYGLRVEKTMKMHPKDPKNRFCLPDFA